MKRRELFKIFPASAAGLPALAPHQHGGAALDLSTYQPRFFSAAEYRMLDNLCEIIMPPVDRSSGGRGGEGAAPSSLGVLITGMKGEKARTTQA